MFRGYRDARIAHAVEFNNFEYALALHWTG